MVQYKILSCNPPPFFKERRRICIHFVCVKDNTLLVKNQPVTVSVRVPKT